MRTGRPILPLTLAIEERETLEHWIRRAKTGQALAQRCRVIVGCAAGKSNAVEIPSALSNTMRARSAAFCGLFPFRTI